MKKEAKMLFITATHGDEGFSIPVLKKLEQSYPKNSWAYDWIVANPKALKEEKRFVDCDLNRSAPGDINSPLYEKRRAAQILNVSNKYDMIIDIHGTSSDCGLVKIIPKPSMENLLMASLFPDLINIIWYSIRSLKEGPLAQFMTKPSLEIECSINNPETEEKLYQTLVKSLLIKKEINWMQLTDSLLKQDWFKVIGRSKTFDPESRELQALKTKSGIAYPFLTNQYTSSAYYLLEKIKIEDTFLYQ